MAVTLADRLSRITSSGTMQVLNAATRLREQGIDVVDFGAGEPDFATPEAAKAAGIEAIAHDFTKYTATVGIPELRAAIAERYRQDYGVSYGDQEIIVTAGGKQALFNTALALFGPGDEVITHAPYWPTIGEQIKLADATPVFVRSDPEDGFRIRADAMLAAITPRTRGFVINSPCNPTGALISESDMAAIADVAAARDLWIVLDLCYEQLIYEPVPHNLPAVLGVRMRERTVLCGSASKSYAMTGWRCGWALAPAPVVAACNVIQSHATSNVSSISQKAAVAAVGGSQAVVTAMLEEYRLRRDLVHGWLTVDPRLRCLKPGGAFYLFVDISDLLSPDGLRTSAEWAQALLDEEHVALTPGEAFDAPGFVRISYATSVERLREGTTRIQRFVTRRAPHTPTGR